MSTRQILYNSSSKKGFGFLQPAPAWAAILELVFFTVCFLLVRAGSLLQLLFPVGALAVGVSSAAMTLTNTVHPPAGATALLAAVQPDISGLGWEFLGVVLLSSIVTTAVACLLNNIHRQYPLYWWSPRETITRVKQQPDQEKGEQEKKTEVTSGGELKIVPHQGPEIIMTAKGIFVPEHLSLSGEERGVLKILMERLRAGNDVSSQDGESDTGDSELSKSRSVDS